MIITDLNNDSRIIKMNKLAKITDLILNWMNLIMAITLKMEDPATPYLRIMCLVLKILRVLNQKHLNIRNLKMVRLFL